MRGFLDLVRNPDYVGRKFVDYFLGTVRALFLDNPYTGPSAEQPPQFYKYVTHTTRSTEEQLPGVEVENVPPSRICEQQAVSELACEQAERCGKPRWGQLTSRVLPQRPNPTFSATRSVTCGIRQGCPHSALLFTVCIDPLLRRVADSITIRAFPLPGQGQVKLSAYADYVSLFLQDEDSVLNGCLASIASCRKPN